MKEQHISLKTAKLAKKKGLDTELDLGSNCVCYNKEGKLVSYHVHFQYPDRKAYTFAPTQSLLQKWLREVHGLILCVNYTNIVGIKWGYEIHGRGTIYVGNSYEESLEAGLQEALTLIK